MIAILLFAVIQTRDNLRIDYYIYFPSPFNTPICVPHLYAVQCGNNAC